MRLLETTGSNTYFSVYMYMLVLPVLVGLPLGLIGRLDRVLRFAAHLIGHIPKYASIYDYMRDVLHWLPVPQRILYRISALVWRSVTGCAPSYLTDPCRPVSDLASRRALCSSARGELLVPRVRSALKQRRAFSVIGPLTWNELPLKLRLLPGTMCLLSASFVGHFSLTVAGLRAPLNRFLEGALYEYPE